MAASLRAPFYLLCLFLPRLAAASLGISEVSWMGDASSANHEWIEVHNSSAEAVLVDGWTITDGNTLSVELSGSVLPHSFAVLERTSDESAPGTAFVVYTGALVNTGTTLTMRDDSGAIIDQVVGGENWQSLGGDNATKETAQYSGTRWLTAPATPGSANATTGSVPGSTPPPSTSKPSSTTIRKPEEKETIKLELANVELQLSIIAPEVVYAGQRVPFSVTASGPNKVVLDSLSFAWNFGDMATGSGRRTSHRYRYPGEYVLNVYGGYGRHEQVARATVTVLPVTLSLTHDVDGNVQVHNDAVYEVVLSGYALSGSKTVVFPERTVLLPRATITVPLSRIGAVAGAAYTLRDAAGLLIADSSPDALEFATEMNTDDELVFTAPSEVLVGAAPPLTLSLPDEFSFAAAPVASNQLAVSAEWSEPEASPMPVAVSPTEKVLHMPGTPPKRDVLGLVVLMSTAFGVLVFTRPKREVTPQ